MTTKDQLTEAAQLTLEAVLNPWGDRSFNGLANQLASDYEQPRAMTGFQLNWLEDAGFVRRSSPNQGKVRYYITEAGEALLYGRDS